MWIVAAEGLIAFAVTNIDDLLLLALYFALANSLLRKRHIVLGQYVGFGAIILLSLFGLAGVFMLPKAWVGLLGLVPILIGLRQLLLRRNEDDDEAKALLGLSDKRRLSFQILSIASVTLANGADNISVYVPLFARLDLLSLIFTIGLFLLLVGVWSFAGYQIIQRPIIGQFLRRYGDVLMPYIFISLGLYILVESVLGI